MAQVNKEACLDLGGERDRKKAGAEETASERLAFGSLGDGGAGKVWGSSSSESEAFRGGAWRLPRNLGIGA